MADCVLPWTRMKDYRGKRFIAYTFKYFCKLLFRLTLCVCMGEIVHCYVYVVADRKV